MEGILDRPLLLAVITTDTQVLARNYSVYSGDLNNEHLNK